MLFMGEEYAEDTPFFYFVNHSDEKLIRAVQKGRKEEFANFKSDGEPPDPQDEKTFSDSMLCWKKRTQGKYNIMLRWHKMLLQFRRRHPALRNFNKSDVSATPVGESALVLRRTSDSGKHHVFCLMNFSTNFISYTFPDLLHDLLKIIDSKELQWMEMETSVQQNEMPMTVKSGSTVTMPPLGVVVYADDVTDRLFRA
jgi:maltooligosyltrehalose trehalohydrolase